VGLSLAPNTEVTVGPYMELWRRCRCTSTEPELARPSRRRAQEGAAKGATQDPEPESVSLRIYPRRDAVFSALAVKRVLICYRQRAFRERKESRLRELEEELASVNAKYNALANDHQQITNQLLVLMAEREELLGTVSSPADNCSPLSPEAVAASRRTSVVGPGREGLVNGVPGADGEEGENFSPRSPK
jgi:hypothetical protein